MHVAGVYNNNNVGIFAIVLKTLISNDDVFINQIQDCVLFSEWPMTPSRARNAYHR